MFEELAAGARGAVAEVGPGLGTFSSRLLAAGVESLLLVEPDPKCVDTLRTRFRDDPRVRIVEEELPAAVSLLKSTGALDFILCQNVLEHVREDVSAVETMAGALRQGGRLAILVPAGPKLFGPLDRSYGHERRYTQSGLRAVIEESGLRLLDLRPFNLLGIAGWWVKNQIGANSLDTRSLAVYEAALPLWRPLEQWLRPRWGLSLIAHAERA